MSTTPDAMDDGLIYQQPAPFHGKVWRHGEDMCSMGAGHSLVCDIASELERQKSRADTAERQAAWLRLVAWGLMHGVICCHSDDGMFEIYPQPEVCGNHALTKIQCELDADNLPVHNPTLEAALTAARESTRSETCR